ncbi:stage III sporulation protein AF [Ornithinibacillus sp. 4-3]|uniref:Stage III sporulation protein AF n=1 Tax=Ornithinibacillus sp. 4-3 TaxID=3231488 RepID=A0AB39HJL4_9BACI
MTFFMEWARQIIIYLLIAAIVDLIIPDISLKKYIKLVFGLILILLFLQPIFHVLKLTPADIFLPSYTELNSYIEVEEQVDQQKSEIQSNQEAYILEQISIELIRVAEKQLAEEYQAAILDIDFDFKSDEPLSFAGLDGITVTLGSIEGGDVDISPIDEVIIDPEKQVLDQENEHTDEIKEYLQMIWELEGKSLQINWEGGTT